MQNSERNDKLFRLLIDLQIWNPKRNLADLEKAAQAIDTLQNEVVQLANRIKTLVGDNNSLRHERDQLKSSEAVMREALNTYIKAGFGNSTDCEMQAMAYKLACDAVRAQPTASKQSGEI